MVPKAPPADVEISPHRKKSTYRKRLMDGIAQNLDVERGARVAIYIRVSSEEQLEGHSLGAQRRVCTDVAEKRGWNVYHVYEDPGFSAKDDRRPAFLQMMADAEQSLFQIILVHKLDRFSRSIENTLFYFKKMNQYNVVFASATENFDFSSSQGRLFFNMMAVFAQWYLENLSAESVKGKEEMFRKGIHNGMVPFGYIRDEKTHKIKVVPDEAEAVRTAFEMAATGDYTDRVIASFLSENFKTRRGRTWSKDTVCNMLRNEFYYGMVAHRDQLRPGNQDAIITRELYGKAREARKSRVGEPQNYAYPRRDPAAMPDSSQFYMLQRIIRCDGCGRHLRIQTAGKYKYYKDSSAERGLSCEMAGRSMKMDEADAHVLDILAQIKLPEDWQQEIEHRAVKQDALQEAQKKKALIDEKLQRLDDVYFNGAFTRDEYFEKRSALMEEQKSLIVPDQMVTLEQGLVLDSLHEYIEKATETERSEICHLILDSVYVNFEEGRIIRIKPNVEFNELFRLAAPGMGWKEKPDSSFII